MARLDKYLKLKGQVEEATQQANRAEGALGETMKQLKREFGCSTLSEAKKKLKQLKKEEETSKKKFDSAFEQFEEDWSGKLIDDEDEDEDDESD